MTVEESPVVLRDAFPADVTVNTPTGTLHWRAARAVVTRQAVYVFVERDGTPHVAWSAAWVEDGTDLRRAWSSPPFRVATGDGAVYINRAAGCGCSSPLRGARLFTGTPRSAAS